MQYSSTVPCQLLRHQPRSSLDKIIKCVLVVRRFVLEAWAVRIDCWQKPGQQLSRGDSVARHFLSYDRVGSWGAPASISQSVTQPQVIKRRERIPSTRVPHAPTAAQSLLQPKAERNSLQRPEAGRHRPQRISRRGRRRVVRKESEWACGDPRAIEGDISTSSGAVQRKHTHPRASVREKLVSS